jgi:ketosteroid isomerase-like protein
MSGKIFPTAQDAENAFYEALERCDLDAMMAVWAEDDDIVCIHPAGTRLAGQDQVRASWTQLFAGGAHASVQVSNLAAVSGVMFAVHSVQETFTIQGARPGDPRARRRSSRPTVYLRTASGWRMIVHHASPAPGEAEPPPPAAAAPKTLH